MRELITTLVNASQTVQVELELMASFESCIGSIYPRECALRILDVFKTKLIPTTKLQEWAVYDYALGQILSACDLSEAEDSLTSQNQSPKSDNSISTKQIKIENGKTEFRQIVLLYENVKVLLNDNLREIPSNCEELAPLVQLSRREFCNMISSSKARTTKITRNTANHVYI